VIASFGASDAEGAWDWKTAYEACEAAQILFLRKFGPAMRERAACPSRFLAMLAKLAARSSPYRQSRGSGRLRCSVRLRWEPRPGPASRFRSRPIPEWAMLPVPAHRFLDPSFTTPIYANLFDDGGGETFSLIWSRGHRSNGD
jgi:hypothetical protein